MSSAKEQEFLSLFDTHADELFCHCLRHIPDHVQAHAIIEKTFMRGWDQMVEGKQLQINEFYRLLDELLNAKREASGLSFSVFFGYFTRKATHSL